jgi:hypothetical protein
LGSELHPFDQVGWKVLKVRNTANVVAILRIVFEAGFKPVEGGDPEIKHLVVWRFPHSIKNKSERIRL